MSREPEPRSGATEVGVPASSRVVEIEDLAFGYGEAKQPALDGLTLSIERGEFACVLGPSGCGKSTLLGILSGLYAPQRGRVAVDGTLVYEGGRRMAREAPPMGYVFQDPRLLPWRRVRQNVELALRAAGVPQAEWERRVSTYLDMCGIGPFAESWPGNLSGGQRQRVAIARALAIEPTLVLMDEPFSTLDEVTARFLRRELLDVWERTGQTIIFVTHSIREAVFLADHVYVMTAGPGKLLERRTIEIPRPRVYEDPHLTEIEAGMVEWVLRHWGFYENAEREEGG
ncbi:MAG TPA: ABC transporter ATP-binding protein [Actinomycetota bacterium]|nr:ABC transporter ATP-binding protein [Actinomycetota bacterium]